MSTQSILPLIYKQKLARILDQMKDSGESEADMRTYARGFKAETIANIRSQHEANQAAELAAQPAFTGIGGDINQNADWGQFLPGMWKGATEDFPHGLAEMGGHALQVAGGNVFAGGDLLKDVWGATGGMLTKGIPELIGGGTPEDVGRFGGQVGAGAALGGLIKGGSKLAGGIASDVRYRAGRGSLHNALQGLVKPRGINDPHPLDVALPWIEKESPGFKWDSMRQFFELSDRAYNNMYETYIKPLETKFKDVMVDTEPIRRQIRDSIASITSMRVRQFLSNEADRLFSGSQKFSKLLEKRAEFNDKLSTYEKKFGMSREQALGDPKVKADATAVNGVRTSINDTIDDLAGGTVNAREMYGTAANLKKVRDAAHDATLINDDLKTSIEGKSMFGKLPVAEEAVHAFIHPTSYAILRAAREGTRRFFPEKQLPDAYIQTAGDKFRRAGLFNQAGKENIGPPGDWQPGEEPPINPPAPVQGTVINPPSPAQGGSPPFVGRPVQPPPQPVGGGPAMPNLVRVGPGQWVAQDVLEAGNPPGQVGPGRQLNLPPYSPSTASEMELNQAAINRPTPRKVGKPPRSTWRMKPDVRAAQPQPGELDVTAKPESVETKPFEVIDKRTQFTAPPENPTVPSSMQEQPINREDIIAPPEGPTKKVGKPPRPLKVKDVRTAKPTESELNRSQGEGLDEPIVQRAPEVDWPGVGEGYHVKWPEMDAPTTYHVKTPEDLAERIKDFKRLYPRQ